MIYAPPFTSSRVNKGITPDRVLLFLKAYHLAHDRLPTRAQIAKHFGLLSPTASLHHLRKLMQRGEVKKDGHLHWRFARHNERL